MFYSISSLQGLEQWRKAAPFLIAGGLPLFAVCTCFAGASAWLAGAALLPLVEFAAHDRFRGASGNKASVFFTLVVFLGHAWILAQLQAEHPRADRLAVNLQYFSLFVVSAAVCALVFKSKIRESRLQP